MPHQSRCPQHWRTLLPPGRDRLPVRSPKTLHQIQGRISPGRRRASRGLHPSKARPPAPVHLLGHLLTRVPLQDLAHLNIQLPLRLLGPLPLDRVHLNLLEMRASLHPPTMALPTMVLDLDHSDHHRREGHSLLGDQDPRDLLLWAVLLEEVILILHRQASLLVDLNLAFHQALRSAMVLDIQYQDPSQRMA